MGGPHEFTEHVERITAKLDSLYLEPFLQYAPRLRRSCQQFQDFVSRLEALAQSSRASSSRPDRGFAEEAPSTLASESESDEPGLGPEDEERSKKIPVSEAAQLRQQAMHVVKGAAQSVPRLQKVILEVQQLSGNWFDEDDRMSHLKHIARMQKRRGPIIQPAEKIRLVLACLSLAKDFRTFEEKAGWQSKYAQTVEQLSQLSQFKPPKLSNHIPNFTSALAVVEKEDLSQGIRLGTKLLLVENLTNRGLTLLLGFECHRISRLSYKALPELKRIFDQEQEYSFLRNYCKAADSWLTGQLEAYEARFSVYSNHIENLSPTTSAPSVMPLPSEITPFKTESVPPGAYYSHYDTPGALPPHYYSDRHGQRAYRRSSGMSMDYEMARSPYPPAHESHYSFDSLGSAPWMDDEHGH